MNAFTQPFANGASNQRPAPHPQQRHSADLSNDAHRMASDRNGAVPMPVATPHRPFQAAPGEVAAGFAAPMGMPRSPPKNKSEQAYTGGDKRSRNSWLRYNADTQHVPCKFFLQGQCQAGRMCPFSHDLESTTRPAPCKYFAKGGCKFGRKCALLHITPDGTVVNRMPPHAFQAGPAFAGAQPQAQAHHGMYATPPPGLLSMQAQGLEQRANGESALEFEHYQYGPRNGHDPQQQIDMTFTSASPKYGSPSQNGLLGISPPQGLSVLDAPLPNSFDSNGISMAARNGPFAASVPSRFGIESPPSSLPRKSQLGNTALRDLHSSAFGDRGMDGMLASMGSSPPSGTDEPLTFPKRSLHSDRLRASRTMVSASLGTKLPTTSFEYSDDEDGDTDREEDLLPASLRDLIPDSRSRRESRNRTDDETPAGFLSAARRTLSGHGTPQDSKIGSLGSSPSRYNSMFSRAPTTSKPETDAFGHVGSPLRNSGFFFASAPKPTNGELSPSVSSPPKQASMSMLTQELQRTKLGDARGSQAQAIDGATSQPQGPIRTMSHGSSGGRTSLDRGLSSTSVGKIDEEQELFDMDEVGGPAKAMPRSMSNGESGFGAIGAHRLSRH
ncbi:hypothetical protein LTR36_003648 [Oleoguttula mirabilis]|uniref:C3H1-type domain-containing protein n=1 Tax=Oleoguttula mirabilis TaxID=1507867 RepID=A0AAV9JIX0_9PEZI|nr:hypothetical protein LTR36_003648 [Oleoguttula mirabilis]